MKHQLAVAAIAALTVSVSFSQQIPVFKVDYSTQDGSQLTLTHPRMETPSTNAPYLHGVWAFEIERSTNSGATWDGIFTNTTDLLPATNTFQDAPPTQSSVLLVNYRAKVSPCLNWKTAVGYHFRNGWNGFRPPFTNKYLKRTMMVEWLNVFSGVTNEVYGSPWTMVETLDPLTGNGTAVSGPGPDPGISGWPFNVEYTAFPFNDPSVFTNTAWTITDTHYRRVDDSGPGNPRYIHYTDVWLSSPNTLAATEAATQALVNNVLSNAEWGTLTMAWYGDCGPETCGDTGQDFDAMRDFYPAIPGSAAWPNPAYPPYTNYPYTPGMSNWVQAPWPVNNYTAAAGSLYIPCNWGGFQIVQDAALMVYYDQPEMYLKWGSIVRGPWGWTLDTTVFATSYNAPFLTGSQYLQTDCGGAVNVQAPPPADGTNWCITAVPASP